MAIGNARRPKLTASLLERDACPAGAPIAPAGQADRHAGRTHACRPSSKEKIEDEQTSTHRQPRRALRAGRQRGGRVGCQRGSDSLHSRSATAIPAGEETGLALDATTNQVFVTSQFGATIELLGSGGIDCVECMAHNQASPMDVTGTGGRLLYTGVTVAGFEEDCELEDTSIPVGLTKTDALTTERLEVTASEPGTAVLRPVNAKGETISEFATLHIVAKPGKTCSIAASYVVTGKTLTYTVTGDVLEHQQHHRAEDEQKSGQPHRLGDNHSRCHRRHVSPGRTQIELTNCRGGDRKRPPAEVDRLTPREGRLPRRSADRPGGTSRPARREKPLRADHQARRR